MNEKQALAMIPKEVVKAYEIEVYKDNEMAISKRPMFVIFDTTKIKMIMTTDTTTCIKTDRFLITLWRKVFLMHITNYDY